MRYTTIIDITQSPAVYQSQSCRMVYLHLCLTCGYHDNDKGLVRKSLRSIAQDTQLTLSAVRHALKVLERYQLVKRWRGRLYVRTWVDEQPITTPAKRARKAKQEDAERALAAENRRHNEQLQQSIKDSKERAVSYEEYLKSKG